MERQGGKNAGFDYRTACRTHPQKHATKIAFDSLYGLMVVNYVP